MLQFFDDICYRCCISQNCLPSNIIPVWKSSDIDSIGCYHELLVIRQALNSSLGYRNNQKKPDKYRHLSVIEKRYFYIFLLFA